MKPKSILISIVVIPVWNLIYLGPIHNVDTKLTSTHEQASYTFSAESPLHFIGGQLAFVGAAMRGTIFFLLIRMELAESRLPAAIVITRIPLVRLTGNT